MRIAMFHYHVKPGGVTQVIIQSVRALLSYIPEIENITLVSGSSENTESVVANIRTTLEKHLGEKISCEIFTDINYIENSPDVKRSVLKQKLLSRYKGYFWWIHNYHLGKNHVFTDTILDVVQNHSEQRVLFHIHDFPECARFEYLHRLTTDLQNYRYPQGENIRYAVINGRDRQILVQAGIPEDQVFLLLNPLDEVHEGTIEKREAQRALEEAVKGRNVDFQSGAPILLYPVRTIRRKNSLEAGLIASCSAAPINLISTLPGVSEQEKHYSSIVEHCYRDHLIPGVWGVGDPRNEFGITFQEIVAASDILISSSVLEGFGYLFINALLWGKPLLARHLDTLEGIKDIFNEFSHYFYDSLYIPLTKDEKQCIENQYREYVEQLHPLLPEKSIARLKHQIYELIYGREGVMDFSFLPVDIQLETLKRSRESSGKKTIRELNPLLFNRLETLAVTEESPKTEPLYSLFSLQTFALTVLEIIGSYTATSAEKTTEIESSTVIVDANRIEQSVQDQFTDIQYLRLLLR